MTKQILIAILVVGLTSIESKSQDTIFFNKEWEKVSRDSSVYFRIIKDTLKLKKIKDYYISGQLQNQFLSKGHDPISKTGTSKTYFEDGKLKSIGTYEDDKLHGEYESYHSSTGALKIKGVYRNGLKEGKFLVYHENGIKANDYNFEKDKLEGEAISYYRDGSIHSQGKYINDKIAGEWIVYKPSGEIDKVSDYQFQFTIPEIKKNLVFSGSRWTEIKGKEIDQLSIKSYAGTPIKNRNGEFSLPPRLHVFLFAKDDKNTVVEYYDRIKDLLGIEKYESLGTPSELMSNFSEGKVFYLKKGKNQSKWSALHYSGETDKSIFFLLEVEEQHWESQMKSFIDTLKNLK